MFLYFIYLHIRSNENDGAILFYYPVGELCTASCAGCALFPPTKDDKTLRLQSPSTRILPSQAVRSRSSRRYVLASLESVLLLEAWTNQCTMRLQIFRGGGAYLLGSTISSQMILVRHCFWKEKIETNNQPSRMVYNRNIGIAIQLTIVLLDHAMIKSVC